MVSSVHSDVTSAVPDESLGQEVYLDFILRHVSKQRILVGDVISATASN